MVDTTTSEKIWKIKMLQWMMKTLRIHILKINWKKKEIKGPKKKNQFLITNLKIQWKNSLELSEFYKRFKELYKRLGFYY